MSDSRNTVEQQARDLLERTGVVDAQIFSSGDLAELANLIDDNESLRQQLSAMTAERDKAKAMPMKYRRMEFNAQLQNENESLRQQLSAALAAIKSKDAALQSAISAHGYGSGDLHDALAIQPDDSALQAFAAKVREQCARVAKDATAYTQFQTVAHYKFASFIESSIRTIKELPK